VKHKALKTLGRYKIVREIGRGAMGVVYEGADPIIGRRVAIKAARRDLLEGEERTGEMMQRFLREARAAGLLNHPGIVTIYDAEEDKDVAFIAMEYMAGGSLKDRLRDRGRLEPKEAVRIGMAICNALAAAHDQGVVHRDIKPANILIHTDGSIKVGDFGIARISDSTLTQDGAIVGTPYCMSPEQVMGQRVDGRSDLFSVGVILYEMLTGQRPFAGDVFAAILHKIVHEDPVPPHEAVSGLNENLSRVVMKSLNKTPEKRYQDGRTMAAALRESLKAEPDPAVLGLDDSAGAQPRAPQHDVSTAMSVRFPPTTEPVAGPVSNRPYEGYAESSGGTSSFTPRLSRLMKRKTLLPSILTTMLLLVIGVITAVVVLGRESVTPPTPVAEGPTQSAAQSTPPPAQPSHPSGPSTKPSESKAKSPGPQKEKSEKGQAEPSQTKSSSVAPQSRKENAPNQEKPKPADLKPEGTGAEGTKAEETEPEGPKPGEPKAEKSKQTARSGQPGSSKAPALAKTPQNETPATSESKPPSPSEPPSDVAVPPPAGPVDARPPEQPPSPSAAMTSLPSATTPANPAPPPVPPQAPVTPNPPQATANAATQPLPVPETEAKDLAALQPALPPTPSAQETESILAELPSVGQLTANLWFADTQEAWDAANNAQLQKGERYALCQTTGTVTVIIRDATLPQRPIIDTQTLISGGSVWLTSPCPQIHVTYIRDGYWPVEREHSASSPGEAVTFDVVLKSGNLP
jgi:serine/threonine protein kinase